MKTKVILLVFLVMAGITNSQAQNSVADVAGALSDNVNVGSMLGSLANGIKPESFKGSWAKNKDSWMKSLKNMNVDDIKGYGKLAGELVGGLKSSSFMKGFDVKGLTKSLGSAGDIGSLAGSLGSLTKGLDKSSLTSDFAGKLDSFTGGLESLPKMK